MMRVLPILSGAVVVIVCGVDYGRHTGRWGTLDGLEAAAARPARVRAEVGDWRSSQTELDAAQLEIAGVAGYTSRKFIHRTTGAEIDVLLICGRPGPMSVHTPDVCYASAGYVQNGPIDLKKI